MNLSPNNTQTRSITKGDIFRYTVMPEIVPRFGNLMSSGFRYVAFFIAMVYQAVRLLPQNHPYTNPANMGKFGIRHVIAEAANNLVINRKNIDQIILFVVVLVGAIIIFLQLALLACSLATHSAMALPTGFPGFFTRTPDEQAQDLAHIMLDMVFGVPDMFNSCITLAATMCQDMHGEPIGLPAGLPGILTAIATSIGPYAPGTAIYFALNDGLPFHTALREMFQFYNIGLLVVGVLLASYFVAVILAETAQTGTAFGKRYNKVWAPIRFFVAFGLLVPAGYGLSSSQYVVLYAAKFGSAFASNGWEMFNDTLLVGPNGYVGQVADLISRPNAPEMGALLQFYHVARTCFELEKLKNNTVVQPYLVGEAGRHIPINDVYSAGVSYEAMVNFLRGANVATVRFGIRKDPTDNPDENGEYGFHKGYVKPICGEVTMTLTDPRHPDLAEPGPLEMQSYYWFIIKDLWFREAPVFSWYPNYPLNTANVASPWNPNPLEPLPGGDYKRDLNTFFSEELDRYLTSALFLQATEGQWADIGGGGVDPAILNKGWASAGIWYNTIAELNGAVTSSVLNVPLPSRYPDIMEYVRVKKRQYDQDTTVDDHYKPVLAHGQDVPWEETDDGMMAGAMYLAYDYWQRDGQVSSPHTASTGNVIIDVINAVFGTAGLYSMRKNPDTHPLAQLVGVGRALVEAAIRNLGFAFISGLGGSAFASLEKSIGSAAATLSSFLVTFAMIGLTAGFILFYVIPFMPFIYFFFAFSGWVKGIFEAMVGAPLWALAHIRIDGNGLPGQAAVNGYFLIFEIFLRPILIIFGLLASISIFSALVSVLNETFDLVTSNLAGFDSVCESTGCGAAPTQIEFYRAPVDEFFFTIVYAIIVYLMGMASFKLVDLIPNNILRWMGQSVPTFGDQREDPAQGLVGTSTVGAQQTLGSLGGGLQGLMGAKGSDVRLKENIQYTQTTNGLPIYTFNYIGDDTTYRGVLAQDVLGVMPEAVEEVNGYLAVDYTKIGLEMKIVEDE